MQQDLSRNRQAIKCRGSPRFFYIVQPADINNAEQARAIKHEREVGPKARTVMNRPLHVH
jgi:hypothetical protein